MFNDAHIATIGIDYRGTPNQLAGCIADATTWGQWARPFAKRTLDRIEGDATLNGIVDVVRDLFSQLKAGDLAIITRSGHGTKVPDRSNDEADGQDEAFVPYDYRNNLLLDDQYRDLLATRPQGTYVMLIDDFCHSGTAARGFIRQHLEAIPGMPRYVPFHSLEGEMCPAVVARLCSPRVKSRGGLESIDEGVIQITGCLDTEFSYDANFDGKPNGAATYYLNRAYRTLPQGGTFNQWYKALKTYLPKIGKYPQTPQLNASEAMKEWVVPGKRDFPAPPAPLPAATQLFEGVLKDGRAIKVQIG
jgi:hypothetical protein